MSTREEAREETIKESIILWEYFIKSKTFIKRLAVQKLFEQGALKKDHYLYECPLCEEYYSNGCVDCPWPMYDNHTVNIRCIEVKESPYSKWANAIYGIDPKWIDSIEVNQYAKEVLELLKKLKTNSEEIAPDRINHLLEKHGQSPVLPDERYQDILFRFMLAIMDELKIMKEDNSETKEGQKT